MPTLPIPHSWAPQWVNTMNSIAVTATMTSREIAELTGKEHFHVLRDIRDLLNQVYDLKDNPNLDYQLIQGVSFDVCPQTKRVSMYHLDKDHTITLLIGYDAKARFKVVKRWQELESLSQPTLPTTPESKAVIAVQSFLQATNLFSCPLHLAQIESVKFARDRHGVDFSQALLIAPAQNNIKPTEEMLEPTELGKQFGLSAREMNSKLESLGLQVKTNSGWLPTKYGQDLCVKHSWNRGSKSGYNLKWNANAVRSAINLLDA